MDTKGTGEGQPQPLDCPECQARVAWNGLQYVCVACPWTEHQEKPPSSQILRAPKMTRSKKEVK
jgi:hypothetical protein